MISWGVFFVCLFLYRCGLSVFAQLAISSLGDTTLYQEGGSGLAFAGVVNSEGTVELTGVRILGTMLTKYIGAALHAASGGSSYAVNIGFQAIAFIGLCKLLMAIEPVLRRRLALLFLMPTFNLWTSVASKEALVAFLFCMVLVRFIEIEREQQAIIRPSTIVYIALLAIIKPHYAAAVCFLFGATLLCMQVRQSASTALVCGVISLIPLWFMAGRIEDLAHTVASHFRVATTTLTRHMYFVDQYDVFLKAPYGMFQSFFGPTISEATIGPLQMASFLESVVLISILGFLVVRRLAWLPVRDVVIAGFSLFWMLFPSYPFGIMNPGSAVRYRAGYIIFVLFVIVFLMLGSLYAERGRRQGSPARLATSDPSVA